MMKMFSLAIIVMAGACANDPQYVDCGTSDTMDTCLIDSANGSNTGTGDNTVFTVTGSLHIPVMPPDSSP